MVNENQTQRANLKAKPEFRRTLVSLCVLAASTGAIAQESTSAEPVGNEVLEEVTVYGTKVNLSRAQDIKRNSDTVVDAISATDINSLPDKSVLEAIQRLPGVSIERFAASNDADHFSVEGSGVVIRGLTQTRSEFNGRDAFAANNDNGLSFQDIPPELVGGVQLVKNQTASMIEGGVSGTINILTRKPFDSEEDSFYAFTAKASYSDDIDEVTPALSATYSTRWENDAGEFGFLINASTANLKSRADGVQLYNHYQRGPGADTAVFGDEDQVVFVPQGANLRRQEFDRDRTGGAMSLQWRSPDEATEVTAEYIYSDSEINWEERTIEYPDQPFAVGPGQGTALAQPFEGSTFTYGADNFFQSGILSNGAGNGGGRYLTYSRDNREASTIQDFSLTVSHDVSDRLKVSGGLQLIDAEFDQLDVSAMYNFYSELALDTSGGIPSAEFLGRGGDRALLTDPSAFYFRSAMDHAEDDEAESVAANLDFEFELEGDFFESVEAGVRLVNRENTIRESSYNWGAVSETWNGGATTVDQIIGQDASLVEEYRFDDFSNGSQFSGDQAFVFPAMSLVDIENYGQYNSRISPFQSTGSTWSSLANRPGAVAGTLFLPNEVSVSELTNQAAYVQLNFGGDLNGNRYSGNVGLRYVKYDWDLTGGVSFPSAISENLVQFLSPEDIAFTANGGQVLQNTVKDSYSKLLPSFNIKYELTENLMARFAFSQAISLPDLRDKRNSLGIGRELIVENLDPNDPTSPVINARINGYNAGGGNPSLNPIESNNFDASLEWYFSDTGSLTGSIFRKDAEGFFRFGPSVLTVTNNDVTRDVLVSGPVNGEDATIQGFEIAYTQFYDMLPAPWDGFGIQANYTYVDSDGSSSSENALTPEGGQVPNDLGVFDGLPLESLSEDTINFVLMFEKGPVSARVAYNYRSEYLLTTRDVITFAPNYSGSTEQVDASISYQINDNFKIGLEANNLSNATNRLFSAVNQDLLLAPRSYFVNDRRFTVTLSGSF
ncbi:TonB-dependent receptor [Arenicella xantha]|uniref:TonB-dependent receptor n=1 Tax=Arenicella xantha TaxID=644221 RepID=A0A395JQ29_9GAMM|nr:TonB-dependent receptor [Arenicella xantha]RBP51678.1 TonB-dependent receptor [Arenicella xantha]